MIFILHPNKNHVPYQTTLTLNPLNICVMSTQEQVPLVQSSSVERRVMSQQEIADAKGQSANIRWLSTDTKFDSIVKRLSTMSTDQSRHFRTFLNILHSIEHVPHVKEYVRIVNDELTYMIRSGGTNQWQAFFVAELPHKGIRASIEDMSEWHNLIDRVYDSLGTL